MEYEDVKRLFEEEVKKIADASGQEFEVIKKEIEEAESMDELLEKATEFMNIYKE